ncbi:MAG TPA: sulfite exporter TauE/SafE family protein, partial [Thermomicrobiales bacterium]|nr:sulfite exporter TauE/SafE family protein [Thermomicrobiales bacterium]
MSHDLLLPVSGFVVGMMVGLTGVGGGVLMTPLLLLLGLPPTGAVGTDLAYSAFTKLAGAWQHRRQGTIDWRVVRSLAIGSVPATVVAVWALSVLHRSGSAAMIEHRLQQMIGVVLVIAAALMVRKVLVRAPGVASNVNLDL